MALAFCFSSYSKADTTTDLLDPSAQNWSGTYGTGYWQGTGGPAPNRIPNNSGFIWSSDANIIGTTIAINTALEQAGIQVEGFSYKWRVKNGNGNLYGKQPGVDDFKITVDVLKADGSIYQSYVYDYGHSHNWTSHTGSETFANNYLPPSYFSDINISAQGSDSAGWTGHYGPEFNVSASEFNLNYSTNPCHENQLYNTSCLGYATAYATQQYNTNCAANALYDPGCPGYTALFQTQQCNANPLFSTACPGYTTAFFNQQCTQDPQYDQNCPGFVVEEAAVVVISAETIAEPSITGDSIVDAILSETVTVEQNPVTVTPVQIEVVTPVVVAVAPVQESNTFDTPEETVASASDNLEGSIEQEIKAFEESSTENTTEEIVVEVEETTEEVVEESVAEITEDGSKEEVVVEETTDKEETIEEVVVEEKIVKKPTPKKVLTKKQKAKAKAKKIKEIVQARGKSLAQQMSTAATVEVQKQLQNQLLAIIGFVPDFSKYGKTNIDGGNLQQEVNLKGGRIVDHQFSRWFLNDPGFAALEEQQYNLRSN